MPDLEHILRVVRDWVLKAENDWLAAVHLRAMQQDFAIDAMGFHAQQSAEKYLKSLLVLHALPVPKTHDLLALIRLVPEDLLTDMSLEDLQFLSTFAVDARYPGPGPVEHDEAVAAVTIAGAVRMAVRRYLPRQVLQGEDGS